MKKLTAGIFATILGVTAMGAADAAVTSKGYVDTAVAAAKAAAISDAEKYIDADELTAELTAGLAGKQDLLQGTMFTKTGEGNVVTGITATNGQVTYSTASVATSDELSTLSGRVDTAVGDITTLQGDLVTVSATANTASANATQALTDAAAAKDAADAAQSAADAAQQTANANTQAIEGLGGTYVAITDYEQDTAAQEQINTQVNTSLESLTNNLNTEATTRENTDNALQAAIDAIESGVGVIESADVGADGNYALTKKVTTVDGQTTTTYVWELIDRDYDADAVTANGQ